MTATRPPSSLRRSARRVLAVRVGRSRADEITTEAADVFPTVAARIPKTRTGARNLLRISAYVVALHQVLLGRGFEPDTAATLLSDAVFESIRRPRHLVQILGRLRHRDRLQAAKWSSLLALRLYYTPPDWEMEEVELEGGFGMDVTRCVVAEFFESTGMNRLCQQAICDQDIRSAARHGLKLDRSGTLSAGADRCDFRYRLRVPNGRSTRRTLTNRV